LRCSAKWASIETRPDKPHKTWLVAELEQPMAETSHFVSATQRDGMGFISPNSQRRNLNDSKNTLVYESNKWWHSADVLGPYLPRRVAQAK